MTIRIAIVGFGNIARVEHLPAIASNATFELAAVVSRSGDLQVGVPVFADHLDMFASMSGKLDAVVIATPPHVRFAIARAALAAGLAVILEKPPASTLGEIDELVRLARVQGLALFGAWHSQHAAGVRQAAALLEGAQISELRISWLEDVRKFHAGQEWVWEPQGLGVFDPGINALSIASAVLPEPLIVREAKVQVPTNRHAPIAAQLVFAGDDRTATFDWRLSEGEEWTIAIQTADGRRLELRDGGNRLVIDGQEQALDRQGEYPPIYARFAELYEAREIEMDREPMRILADVALIQQREVVEPFHWTQPS
jgi:predicted dehydrogenase